MFDLFESLNFSVMKARYFLSILLVTILLCSCKKGKANFVLRGTLTDLTFSKNLSGATVKLYQVPVASAQEQLLQTITSGEDGSFSFTFPRDKMEKYVLKISKEGYFDIQKDVYFSELTIEEDNVRNYATTAKSWVKLRFINTVPSFSDHLRYIKQEGKVDCQDCCSKDEQNYFGALDTAIYCINDANTNYSYYYWIIGTPNQGLKSAYTTPFDTTEILLEY